MSADDGVLFGVLHPDGSLTDERRISQDVIRACPNVLLVAEHYCDDGSCKCDDPFDDDMTAWGYEWDAALGHWS